MNLSVKAIYENGVFRPILPIEGIEEQTEVDLHIMQELPHHPLKKFAGILSKDEAEELIQIVNEEFGKVNPDEW